MTKNRHNDAGPTITAYHGTCQSIWNPENDGGYLYLTRHLLHAKAHAEEKAEDIGSEPVIFRVSISELPEGFELMPDNDVHELDGYETWQDSYEDKGSFILVGDTRTLSLVALPEMDRQDSQEYEFGM